MVNLTLDSGRVHDSSPFKYNPIINKIINYLKILYINIFKLYNYFCYKLFNVMRILLVLLLLIIK